MQKQKEAQFLVKGKNGYVITEALPSKASEMYYIISKIKPVTKLGKPGKKDKIADLKAKDPLIYNGEKVGKISEIGLKYGHDNYILKPYKKMYKGAFIVESEYKYLAMLQNMSKDICVTPNDEFPFDPENIREVFQIKGEIVYKESETKPPKIRGEQYLYVAEALKKDNKGPCHWQDIKDDANIFRGKSTIFVLGKKLSHKGDL
jgi:hypothetical protein